MPEWGIQDSARLYNLPGWSDGYIDINAAGNLCLQVPGQGGSTPVDLKLLVPELRNHGLETPLLVRVPAILHDRIERLQRAFATAIGRHAYSGAYQPLYPVKVNQRRGVIEALLGHASIRVGLEAGSKAELLAAMALMPAPGGQVICNGYKDREFIRLALIGQAMGLQVCIVIEKPFELELVLQEAARIGVRPRLGVRIRLASIAAGNWQNTGGHKSKFGLQADQVLALLQRLRDADLSDCLRLLHFHIGSQIPRLKDFQRALREGARYYAELRRLGTPIDSIDVGGGLGVDYEGSGNQNFCSMDYDSNAYAETVVAAFSHICRKQDLPAPDLLNECGRALTAHHAFLLTDVIGVESAPMADAGAMASITTASPAETHARARATLEQAHEGFAAGQLTLEQRIQAEHRYFATCRRLLQAADMELRKDLHEELACKVFCNFSLFQSLPDSWALGQIFPIVPLQQLQKRPTRHAIIQDLTCDSDGRIDHYVNHLGLDDSLPLHELQTGEDYLLGIFLLGAYQEGLGDRHNLFGETCSVNLEIDARGHHLSHAHPGERVADVIGQIDIDAGELLEIYRERLRGSAVGDHQAHEWLETLRKGIDGSTYFG